MLAGVGAFVTLDWSRVGLWLIALAFGALAFGALGVAIGALAREVRAASLLAFLLSLAARAARARPRRRGLRRVPGRDKRHLVRVPVQGLPAGARRAVNSAAPPLPGSLAHLAGLTILFGLLARAGLRRAE